MPLYTEKDMREQKSADAVLIIAGIAIVFINLPGMTVLAVLRDLLDASWGLGQMWAFSIIVSVLTLTSARLMTNGWRKAATYYAFICISVALVLAVCFFCLKQDFPARYLVHFFWPMITLQPL